MMAPPLSVVTATVDPERALPCLESWGEVPLYVVEQGQPWRWNGKANAHRCLSQDILGVVPAFEWGVRRALEDQHQIIACLHDDLEILQREWQWAVLEVFLRFPQIGLVGLGGALGLADEDIYRKPYNPMQLARKDFRSNMRHAEAHGVRTTEPERVAVLDGFSQIGRREFWAGMPPRTDYSQAHPSWTDGSNLFQILKELGVVHHAYDAALGCFAKRLGWEVWMLPIPCHHHGGLTAVADSRYHQWAASYSYQDPDRAEAQGDAAFWEKSHRVVYETFRDVLPIRV